MNRAVPTSLVILLVFIAAGIVIISQNLSGGIIPNEIAGGVRVGCADNDGGSDLYTKGTCSDRFGTFTDYCAAGTLIEYNCGINNKCTASYQSCPQGNVCSDGTCVQANNNPPTVSITISPTKPTISSQITFTAIASDDVELRQIDIYVDNADTPYTCSASGTYDTCLYTGGPYSIGLHSFNAIATDTSYQTSDTGTMYFNVSAS